MRKEWKARSERHNEVKRQYHVYRRERAMLFASDYILDELFTRLMYDFGKHIVGKAISLLRRSFAEGDVSLLMMDAAVFEKSRGILMKFSDHRISFTDATTYVFCKTFGIDEVFTLDSDFRKMGLKVSL